MFVVRNLKEEEDHTIYTNGFEDLLNIVSGSKWYLGYIETGASMEERYMVIPSGYYRGIAINHRGKHVSRKQLQSKSLDKFLVFTTERELFVWMLTQ